MFQGIELQNGRPVYHIREWRMHHRLRLNDLAEIAGVPKQTIWSLEEKPTMKPSIKTAHAVAMALNLAGPSQLLQKPSGDAL